MTEPLTGVFLDAETGETIVRELTAEEIAQLPTDQIRQEPETE